MPTPAPPMMRPRPGHRTPEPGAAASHFGRYFVVNRISKGASKKRITKLTVDCHSGSSCREAFAAYTTPRSHVVVAVPCRNHDHRLHPSSCIRAFYSVWLCFAPARSFSNPSSFFFVASSDVLVLISITLHLQELLVWHLRNSNRWSPRAARPPRSEYCEPWW